MSKRKVTAIINISDYDAISEYLTHLDLPGVTVTRVQGFGDYINEFAPHGFSDNLKIEIYTSAKQAEQVANILAETANAITEGGGMVAIEPVDSLMNVRKLGN